MQGDTKTSPRRCSARGQNAEQVRTDGAGPVVSHAAARRGRGGQEPAQASCSRPECGPPPPSLQGPLHTQGPPTRACRADNDSAQAGPLFVSLLTVWHSPNLVLNSPSFFPSMAYPPHRLQAPESRTHVSVTLAPTRVLAQGGSSITLRSNVEQDFLRTGP